jgi:intergrase/recombinase
MERLFSDDLNYDSMLKDIKELIRIMPPGYGEYITYNCCVGLRSSESVASVHLIHNRETFQSYFNPTKNTLEHFKFASIMMRRTKKCYISIISPEVLDVAARCKPGVTYNALRLHAQKKGMKFKMSYARKLFASWLSHRSIPDFIIDALQGRCAPTVLARHYLVVQSTFKDDVLRAVHELLKQIEG